MTCAPVRPPLSARRQLWFRLTAMLLALFPLLCMEAICRVFGWGEQDLTVDPFVGFTAVRPLFLKTADGQHYRTAPDRLQYFREDQFAARKPADEFRVFVFGGSTVQGHPFSIETSFPTFLQQILETAQPGKTWKVVNCGGVSYASYRLLPIVAECLTYEPDLFIFCSGQNEFLEDVTYPRQRRIGPILGPVWSVAEHLQAFRAAVQLTHALKSPSVSAGRQDYSHRGLTNPRPLLPTEVQTLLDQHGGLERYHRDDQRAEQVARHYGSNLQRLILLCRQHELPLLVIQPPINLSDCPPFKSEFSGTTTLTQQADIAARLREARHVAAKDPTAAVHLAEQVTRTDPRYALSWYELGQLLLNINHWEDAQRALQRAVDEDICPLRMTGPLQRILRQTVAAHETEFLDAHTLLAAGCRGGVLGEQRLVDHVHPSFKGHEDIAVAIAEWMQLKGLLLSPRDRWPEYGRQRCQQTVQQLDDTYFLQGRRRLQVLKNWAAGRATVPELVNEPPAIPPLPSQGRGVGGGMMNRW
ncbi:MAG: tetratricopeptide repeat protein [Planctomycetota bacterium]